MRTGLDDGPLLPTQRERDATLDVPLDDWELNFLIDLLGPPTDMAPRTRKLYRKLKSTRLPALHETDR